MIEKAGELLQSSALRLELLLVASDLGELCSRVVREEDRAGAAQERTRVMTDSTSDVYVYVWVWPGRDAA